MTEHIICFLMVPRAAAQTRRYQYMATSLEKDEQWEAECRHEQETGIPRAKKPRPPKPVVGPGLVRPSKKLRRWVALISNRWVHTCSVFRSKLFPLSSDAATSMEHWASQGQ